MKRDFDERLEPKSSRRSMLPLIGTIARDTCGAVGFASLIYGIAQIYVPVAWIVGGAIVICICILSARGQQS